MSAAAATLRRLRSSPPPRADALLWSVATVGTVAGLVAWATGTLGGGVAALWCFVGVGVALALALPMPYALAAPLFAGVLGWLVDMLPLVILVGWAAVVARHAAVLLRERRFPIGGNWIWLPIALAAWTALGIVVVSSVDRKHFLLLFSIQALMSGVILVAVDALRAAEERTRLVTALAVFVVVLTVAVVLEYVGAPIQELQNGEVSERVEEAYGVDAFPNNLGMIKYGRSSKAGAKEFRARMERFARDHPALPPFVVFLPRFQAFENHLVVRFSGSARASEDALQSVGVALLYDSVGLAPANTVPRFRSLARNSLTYAGTCVLLFPLSLYLVWTQAGRRRWLGWAAAFSCLVGAGFSLARGAWLALLIGVLYIVFDTALERRRRAAALAVLVVGALVVTAIYVVKYDVDPLTARAEAQGSINTREEVYADTVGAVIEQAKSLVLGFGTERPRTESGTSHVLGRYIPDAGTHSTYLNYLFRTGVPGVGLLIALYVYAALRARAASRALAGDDAVFASVSAASVVALAAHGVVLTLFVEPIYTLVGSLVLALAVGTGSGVRLSLLSWRQRPA